MASTNFINECKNRTNANRLGQLVVENIENPITQSDNLQSFTIDSGCYVDGNIIGAVYVKKLISQLVASNNINLVDKILHAQIGVKYADNSTEYIEMGKYIVERPKDEKTANMTQITAYSDLNNKLESNYICGINYSQGNITLKDLYVDVCNQLGLIPSDLEFTNNNIPISNNPFTNNEKNRIVLQTIAKIASSFIDIDNTNNQINLCWLSQSIEPDYTFNLNDYALLEGGKITCGPINCLIIKSSQIDDENVTIKDEESISLNGEHAITISEDYILYNAELRQQAITAIWNKVHNMTYVDSKLTTYYGKPFLKLGDKIRIYTSETEYFDTYVLKHNFTYDGTFASVVESPVLTQQEIKTKQNVTLGNFLKNTQIIVNKQNQTIQSVVSQTNEQNQKIAQVTQTVEELNSKIGDIADITTSAEDTDAQVEINEVNQSEPIRLVVRPIGKNISYLYPSDNLYPSDDLYMSIRTIRFHNNTTNEDFDYELPDDLLYYDSENYDEFILDYDAQSCVINKRVGYNEDGTTYVLDTPKIVEYEFPKIVLTEGDYTVSILSYENGYIFARLMAKNIYTTQFYTKAEVDSQISQTAKSIDLSVNQKLSNYSTTNEMNSAISLKANEITSSVSNTYATKTALSNTETTLNSKIEQTAKGITSSVSETYLTKTNAASTYATQTTTTSLSSRIKQTAKTIELVTTDNKTSAGITIRLKNEDGTQIDSKSANITLSGLVKFTDLSTNGSTTINGSNITTGTIDASKVTVKNLSADNITSGTLSANKISGGTITASAINLGNGTFSVTTAGKVTATSGSIGGWNIGTSAIEYDATNYKVSIIPGTNANKDFLVVYNKSNNTYPFFVRADGYVSASNINITGGSIGGMLLSGGILSSDRLSLNATSGILSVFNNNGGSMILSNACRLSATAGVGISANSTGSVSAPSSGIDIKGCSGANVYIGCMSNSAGTTEKSCVSVENGILAFRSSGYATYNGSTIWGSSSLATKENISDLTKEQKDEVYELIKNISLKKFDYKEQYSGQKNNYGFIIEDIENTYLKTLLHISQSSTNEDIKNYSTEDLARLELVVIQELMKKIERLEEQLNVD